MRLVDKHYLICADDFAFSESINAAILDLLRLQRISAVSCMTNMPLWQNTAQQLKPFQSQVKIGLHFNIHYRSLVSFILACYMGLICKRRLRQSLQEQLQQFEQAMGCKPDFIDGHQHIHQLPVVRDVLLQVYHEQFPDKQAFIRSTRNSQHCLKAKLINLLGGLALDRLLNQQQVPHNHDFAGIYDFKQSPHYANYFKRFCKEIKTDGLIMCHPGLEDEREPFRANEYRVLKHEECT